MARQTRLGRSLFSSALRQGLALFLCVLLTALTVGCEDPALTQTEAFEYAEAQYRTGKYDAALDGYQAFLEAYPTSPLAKTAELRIRCIHREVRSVLMRKDMPRPDYVRHDYEHKGEDDDELQVPKAPQ